MYSASPIKRSLIAIGLCIGLLIVFFEHRKAVQEAERQMVYSASNASWKISELVYEAQRFFTTLANHGQGEASLYEVQVQFEVFWSRTQLVAETEFPERIALDEGLNRILDWLEQHEDLIFSENEAVAGQLAGLRSSLEPLVISIRQNWVREFNASRNRAVTARSGSESRQNARQEFLIAVLIACIVLYLVVEVYLGTLAHRREQVLRAAADAANRTKSDFIASVSHEIRTPLNGIISMASHLGDHPLSPELRECVSIIEDSGGLLLSTINDVLDLSKIEAGEMPIEFRPFDPGRSLSLARDLYRDQAGDKGLSLDLVIQGDPLPLLIGDERRTRQVLHNLVSNAVKFTEHGHVRITASHGVSADGADQFEVCVSDTGPGIAATAQATIFEPFGQADASISRDFGGTGLGLAISRTLCRAMGGELRVMSTPGQGAEFTVTLPFVRASADAVREWAGSTAQPAEDTLLHGRVLIVDDNATNRLILRKLLGGQRLDFFEAASGPEALDFLGTEAVDLVLMDVQMPGMNGIETTARLVEAAELAGKAPPPVIAVTANVMPEQVDAYHRAGMTNVLPKPVSKNALIAKMRESLPAANVGTVALKPPQDVA
ncbi:ATP-binding protein [uncultured Tateyamaria sp.]|uniref:ATP-binding protein n=1 Tax=uncultured Tateyamaria sp. TaxID=455651 RepID=UPI00260E6881|nr:ATP-binding protein [uncultured Tateyamaria sp.]